MIGEQQARIIKERFKQRYNEPDLAVGISRTISGAWALAVRTSHARPDLPRSFEGLEVDLRVIGRVRPLANGRRRA